MSTTQLTEAALRLSLDERIGLAQRLWKSAFNDEAELALRGSDEALLPLVRRRASELDNGEVAGIPHERAMAEARRALNER